MLFSRSIPMCVVQSDVFDLLVPVAVTTTRQDANKEVESCRVLHLMTSLLRCFFSEINKKSLTQGNPHKTQKNVKVQRFDAA